MTLGDAWKALFDLAGGFIREYDQEAMVSLRIFVDQLPSVMNQVLYESNFIYYFLQSGSSFLKKILQFSKKKLLCFGASKSCSRLLVIFRAILS